MLIGFAASDEPVQAQRIRAERIRPAAPLLLHRRPLRTGPLLRFHLPRREPTLLAPPPPDEYLLPPIGEPSPLIEDQIGPPLSLPHSFALTVPLGGADPRPVPASLNRFAEVGPALSLCWQPPAGTAWSAITVRLAFRRDGTIFGVPRIAFVDAGTAEAKSSLAQSLLAALKTCKPLPLSPSLGAAVAGEIFAIRFVHQD